MKQNTKLWFIAFGFLCSTTAQVANGQNNPSAIMTKTFPASPEVSSLGGYGNFGDASFSGTIDISIPLYTI
jgi:hypothetical protein